MRDVDLARFAIDGPREARLAWERLPAAEVVGEERAGGEAALQEDLVRGVFLDGRDDFVVLRWVGEGDGGALVAEDGVDGGELAESGEEEVNR